MINSILTSTKQNLGIVEADTAFDHEIISHINGVFARLNQLGIGPANGFMIEDKTVTWDAYLGSDLNLNSVRTYVFLKVKILFDPPQTSFVLNSVEKQIEQLEWTLNVKREDEEWVDPFPPVDPYDYGDVW